MEDAEDTVRTPIVASCGASLDEGAPRHRTRLALVATVVVACGVAAMLPLAADSMRIVLGNQSAPLYDLLTGEPVTPDAAAAASSASTYVNFGLVALDPIGGSATLAVSGNRRCAGPCEPVTFTLTGLDDDADQRRGLPPSATLTLSPTDKVFSRSVQLPVRGRPGLYPFDDYLLWLGVAGVATAPDGTTADLRPDMLAGQATFTLQNRIPGILMSPPVALDPQVLRSVTDPFAFLTVQALKFERPLYLKVLAVALVLLIAATAALALFLRTIEELALGIGGLILGVWGIRSILMPQALPTVTAVDLALSWVIVLLLLGLTVRAARHFQRDGLPTPPP
jgi:hypothetical protein